MIDIDADGAEHSAEFVYGWVMSVGKSLPSPYDDENYTIEDEDLDWKVVVVDEDGKRHEFSMDAGAAHPMVLIGKWIEVRIEGSKLTISGIAHQYYSYAKRMIERE